jgi:DNA-binding IclR family transcriptional regulator
LASALVVLSYLRRAPGGGYALGPKLVELGFRALHGFEISRVARPHLEELARRTGDTVHLGVLDEKEVLYLDKISGTRRVEFSSRIGERQPVWSTGLGKALILHETEQTWRSYFGLAPTRGPQRLSADDWVKRMREYVRKGCAFDLEENEPQVCCVACSVRDASGKVAAAISVASLSTYMDSERMEQLIPQVCETAEQIGRDLGCFRETAPVASSHSADRGLHPAGSLTNSSTKRRN